MGLSDARCAPPWREYCTLHMVASRMRETTALNCETCSPLRRSAGRKCRAELLEKRTSTALEESTARRQSDARQAKIIAVAPQVAPRRSIIAEASTNDFGNWWTKKELEVWQLVDEIRRAENRRSSIDSIETADKNLERRRLDPRCFSITSRGLGTADVSRKDLPFGSAFGEFLGTRMTDLR